MASVEVDVYIDQFDDEEILEAAIGIVRAALKREPNDRNAHAELIGELRKALSAPAPEGWPTTAARLKTFQELAGLVEASNGFYRFAGDGA